ncbi:MAG: DUF2207 domain-containing protein [Candidatus Electrothrix sp. AX5]|nr:DUF2207 domain-containing protein [Candidatus Electrothrix sp. AX5]
MKKKQRLFVLIAGLLFFFSAQTAEANSSSFYWEFIHVDIDLQDNGDMLVTETMKYIFTESVHPTKRNRSISNEKLDGIEDVKVFERNEGEKKKLSVTTRRNGDTTWIGWRHEPGKKHHTFVLKYRVKGGVHVSNEEISVYWQALSDGRAVTIKNGKLLIHFPVLLAEKNIIFNSTGVKLRGRQINSQTIQFLSDGIFFSNQKLIVSFVVPSGILNIPVPRWQKLEEIKQKKHQEESSDVDWSWLFPLLFFLISILLKKGGIEIGGDGE